MTDTLLRINHVTAATSLSKATIYRLINRKEFPAPAKIAGSARWSSGEIDAWMKKALDDREEQSDARAAA